MRRDEYVLHSDREDAERRRRNRWIGAGLLIAFVAGAALGFYLGA
jgi:hypothetical protein